MKIYVRYDLNKNEQQFSSFEEILNYNEVVYINCSYNQLNNLPKLPNSLIKLKCYNNQLSSLPELPNSLKNLECSFNQLSSLPKLPNSLQKLLCYNNQLSSLPKLPNSLQYLWCQNNQFITKQEKYIQKIIYSISQFKNIFIDNLFWEFGEKCLECNLQFININKYKFKKFKGKNITIKNNYCSRCSKN